jgi:hypothetical protein
MFDLCQSKAVAAPDLAHALKANPADGLAVNPANGNTPLHSLCLNEKCTLRVLHTYLDLCPGAAAVRNGRGQWAMHQLATNPSITAEMAALLLLHTPLASAEVACDASGATPLHAWVNFGASLGVPTLAALLNGGPPGLGLQPDAQGASPLTHLAASAHCTEALLACYLHQCPAAGKGLTGRRALAALAGNHFALSGGAMLLLLRHFSEPGPAAAPLAEGPLPLAALVVNPRLAASVLGMYLDRFPRDGNAPVTWAGVEGSGGTALHLMARKFPPPLRPAVVAAYASRCPEALAVLDLQRNSAVFYLACRPDASAALLLATAPAPRSTSSSSLFSTQVATTDEAARRPPKPPPLQASLDFERACALSRAEAENTDAKPVDTAAARRGQKLRVQSSNALQIAFI